MTPTTTATATAYPVGSTQSHIEYSFITATEAGRKEQREQQKQVEREQ
jgi:hypothetical protein